MKNLKNAKLDGTNPFIDIMYDVLNQVNYKDNTTIVTIDGVDYIADELYIRALQCVAARIADDDKKWIEFNNRIQVWNNKKKTEQMQLRKTGNFDNKFVCSIFTAIGELHMEVLKNEYKSKK